MSEALVLDHATVQLLAAAVARELSAARGNASATLPDYSVSDLAVLTHSDTCEITRQASRIVGHYRRGRQHFFDRSAIDFARASGGNLYRD